jgi:hypothetical protein
VVDGPLLTDLTVPESSHTISAVDPLRALMPLKARSRQQNVS